MPEEITIVAHHSSTKPKQPCAYLAGLVPIIILLLLFLVFSNITIIAGIVILAIITIITISTTIAIMWALASGGGWPLTMQARAGKRQD